VINAYPIAFGGLLLLGGRRADPARRRPGKKRVMRCHSMNTEDSTGHSVPVKKAQPSREVMDKASPPVI